jgi:putative flippase GtrA
MDQVKARVQAIEWWRALRYSGVSVIATICTQVLLVVGHAGLGVGATAMNVTAVMLTSIPAYLLNRRWVWQVAGPSSLRREIIPFWAFTVAGLLLSTLAVTAVASVTESAAAVSAANIGAFGILWVAKFFVLDDVVFSMGGEELVPA